MATTILTPIYWTNLVPGKVISLTDLKDNLTQRLRAAQWQVQQDLWGAGGTFDAPTAWTRSAAKLTMSTAAAVAYTPTGHRLNLVKTDPFAGLQNVPYEDDGVSTYQIMARWSEGVGLLTGGGINGTDGQPHYPTLQDYVGRILIPDSVTQDGAGTLAFNVTSSLYEGEKFASVVDSRLCLFYYSDPVSGGPYAAGTGGISAGLLTHDGAGNYTITPTTAGTDLLLGNPAADLTAANFRVIMMGPTILKVGTDTLTAEDLAEHVELSRVVATVLDSSFAPLINNVGTWIAAFNVQHDNATGVHLDVTADTLEVQAANNVIQNPLVTVRQQDGTTVTELRTDANGGGVHAGELAFVNIDSAASGKARIACYTVGAVESILEITRPATQSARLVVDGRIRKNSLKAGIPFAIQADNAVDETLTIENVAAGVLDLMISGGELNWTAGGRLNGTNSGAGHFMIELDVGVGCSIDAIGGVDAESVEAANGFFANPVTASGWGYQYATSEEPEIRQSYPGGGGGWCAENYGTNGAIIGGSGEYIAADAVASTTRLKVPIDFFNAVNFDGNQTIVLDRLDLTYWRANAGDSVSVQVQRMKKDMSGSVGVIATESATTVAAAYNTDSQTGIAHTVDQTYNYWLLCTISNAAALADARMGNVLIGYTKTAVE